MDRKAFKFYRSYYDVALELEAKDRYEFLMALLDYQFTGKHKELKGLARFAFISQKHSIDAQIEGFIAKVGPLSPPTQGGSNPPSQQEEEKEEEKGKGGVKAKNKFSDDFYQSKEQALEELKSDDLYIDECHRLITGKGWRVATKVNLMQILVVFLLGKADLTSEKSDIKKHFKNWLIREKLDTLTKICNEG
jgi:hypothetical protein